ncbi:CHAT domain-containing protein [Scytonema sp. NUACC21]
MRIKFSEEQTTNVSTVEDCKKISNELKDKLNSWLKNLPADDSKKIWLNINKSDSVRFLLKIQDIELQRLPWHLCSLFQDSKAEVALGVETSQHYTKNIGRTARILAIFGNDDRINLSKDNYILKQLEEQKIAIIKCLEQPRREDLNEQLWKQPWDFLFFAGHSSSQSPGGRITINANDSLSPNELKHGLQIAVDNGLKLAIFNSCDGLGLLGGLAGVGIPYTIVMREPIPDEVAHLFLGYFLKDFAQGKSLHESVRRASDRLQGIEDKIPCATWLPVICHHPNSATLTWVPNRKLIAIKRLASQSVNVLHSRKSHWLLVIGTMAVMSLAIVLVFPKIKEFIFSTQPNSNLLSSPSTKPTSVPIFSQKPVILYGKSQGNIPSDISTIAISYDKKILASKSENGNIDVWRLENMWNSGSKQPFLSIKDTSKGGSLAISPDLKNLASGGFGNSNINFFKIAEGNKILELPGASYGVNDMVFNPKRNQLIIGDSSQTIKIFNIAAPKEQKEITRNSIGRVYFLAVSKNGEKLFIVSQEGIIEVWNLVSGTFINSFKITTGQLTSLSLNPDDKKMVVGVSDGSIQIWDVENGRQEKTHKFTNQPITSVIFTQDGLKVICASREGYIYDWNLTSKPKVYKLSNYIDEKIARLYKLYSDVFAIGFDSNYIKIWKLPNNNL